MCASQRLLLCVLSILAFAAASSDAHAAEVRMTAAEVTHTESAGPITIGITLPPGRSRSFLITWQFDRATSPQLDMTATSGSINVLAGATVANITTTLIDDSDPLGDRLHTVTISTTDPEFPVAADGAQTVLRLTDSDLPNFPGLAADGLIFSLAPRRAGGHVAIGSFTNIMGSQLPGFAALRPNGRPDPSVFGIQYNFGGSARAGIELPDGKFLLAGPFATINGIQKPNVARLNANGTLDETFSLSAPFTIPPSAIGLASDGSILVSGWNNNSLTPFNGESPDRTSRGIVARLDANGTRDADFTTATLGTDFGLLALPAGKFLLYGNVRAAQTPWNRNDPVPPPVREGIFRVNLDGSLDLAFQADTALPNFPSANSLLYPKAVVTYPDGRLIVAGGFTAIGGESAPGFARLAPDGGVDIAFLNNVKAAFSAVTGGAPNMLVQKVGLSSDDAIALAVQLPIGSRLIFLNADGTLASHTQIAQGFIGAIAPLQGERFLFSFSHLTPQRLAIYSANGRFEAEPIAALAPLSHDLAGQFTLKIHSLITGQLNLLHTDNFAAWVPTSVMVTTGEQTVQLPAASHHTFFRVANPAK